MVSQRHTILASALLLACLASCKKNESPPPQKEPPKDATSAAPSASAATAPERAPKEVPTLVFEAFEPKGDKPQVVFGVEGAVVVTHQQRVGRIVGDEVEWLKQTIPAELGGPLATHIDEVRGRFPDAIDVLYSNESQRVPVPSYMPLTGKGRARSLGYSGAPSSITDLASIGDSVLLLGWSYDNDFGIIMETVRGPKLEHKQQMPTEAGCKPGEVERAEFMPIRPAIWARAMAASRSGTLVMVGNLCDKRGPALEVWETPAKSKFVDLSPFVKDIGWFPKLVAGKDEVWLHSGKNNPIIEYKDGEAKALPKTPAPPTLAFVSTSGALHVVAGASLLRLDQGAWTELGRLSWPMLFRSFVVDGDSMWASANDKVYRVRQGKGWSFGEDCKTPFVYLYDVNPGNANKFTFPSTRKALSTFPGVAELRLVEINEGARRLGVVVKSKEQGEALIAHVKDTMKDEDPILICHAPKNPRVIEIKDGK